MDTMWTHFWDMHSGGGLKEGPYHHIFIEAGDEQEARVVFYNRFGHSPDRVTCTCCGEDYSVSSKQSLAQLTGYHRNLRCLKTPRDDSGLYKMPDDPYFHEHYYLEPGEEPKAPYEVEDRFRFGEPLTLEEYFAREDVLVIRSEEIKPEERRGSVPTQGYVWQD